MPTLIPYLSGQQPAIHNTTHFYVSIMCIQVQFPTTPHLLIHPPHHAQCLSPWHDRGLVYGQGAWCVEGHNGVSSLVEGHYSPVVLLYHSTASLSSHDDLVSIYTRQGKEDAHDTYNITTNELFRIIQTTLPQMHCKHTTACRVVVIIKWRDKLLREVPIQNTCILAV